MREGRRQRLGLQQGTEGTVQDTYLDRILSDVEVEGEPNILNIGSDANVRTTDQRYLSDAYNYLLGGGYDASQPDFPIQAEDITGGQMIDTGVGGGGQTLPGFDVDSPKNTDFEQNLIDQGIGVQAEPGAPISAPGEGMLTQEAIDDLADYPVTPVNEFPTGDASLAEQIAAEDRAAQLANVQDPTNMLPQLGTDTPTVFDDTATLEDAGAIGDMNMPGSDYFPEYQEPQSMLASEMIEAQKTSQPVGLSARGTIDRTPVPEISQALDDEYYDFDTVDQQTLDAPYGVNPDTGIPYETPRTIADQNRVLGIVTEEDVANPKGLLEKIGLGNLDIKKTAVMAAINKAVGAPVSLLISALQALPQYEPTFEERTLEEELGVTEGGKFSGDPNTSAFAGLNAVSAYGDPVETAKDRIETRLETIENNPNISEEFKENTQTMIDEWEAVTNKLGDIDDDSTGDAQIAEQIEADNRAAAQAAAAQAAAAQAAAIEAQRRALQNINAGGGGADYKDDPAPSAPPGEKGGPGYVDPGPTPTKDFYQDPITTGGGGNQGDPGSSKGCVIATHAVNSGAFTKDTKREAVRWCVKNLHRTWWGEAVRKGYKYYGQKAIEQGKAKNHYQEFKDYVAFGTGKRRTLKTGWTFVYRTIQFFLKGLTL